jgi:hypothetical protein
MFIVFKTLKDIIKFLHMVLKRGRQGSALLIAALLSSGDDFSLTINHLSSFSMGWQPLQLSTFFNFHEDMQTRPLWTAIVVAAGIPGRVPPTPNFRAISPP